MMMTMYKDGAGGCVLKKCSLHERGKEKEEEKKEWRNDSLNRIFLKITFFR